MNITELFSVMYKYIKNCDVLKWYHLNPNEISFEAVKIIDLNTCTKETTISNRDIIVRRNLYSKSERKKLQR